MSKQKELVKCPKCGQDKGELEFTESAVKELHSLPGEKNTDSEAILVFTSARIVVINGIHFREIVAPYGLFPLRIDE